MLRWRILSLERCIKRSWPLLPPSYERQLGHARRIELASDRRIRAEQTHLRLSHWPIWIFVFFIAPGPLTFDLFNRLRLANRAVARCRVAGDRHCRPLRKLRASSRPTSSASPRIGRIHSIVGSATRWRGRGDCLRRTQHRRPCDRGLTGAWRLRQMCDAAYFPIVITIWVMGALDGCRG